MFGDRLLAAFGAFCLLAGSVNAQEEAAQAPAPESQAQVDQTPSASQEGNNAAPAKALLKNGDFSDWDGKKPSEWECPYGTMPKQAEETWEGHPVVQIDPMNGKPRQVDQQLRGLEKQIRGGDTIRFVVQMRCEEAEKADIYIARQYEVAGKMTYKHDRQYGEGDGTWRTVVLERKIDARELSEPSSLMGIHVGIRGEEGSLKPIYVSNATLSIEHEEMPQDETAPVNDTAHLLKNADFAIWGEKGPANWNVGSGLAAKETQETLDGKAVIEVNPIPGRANRLLYQYLDGLASFVRAGDLVRLEMRVKCESQEQAVVFMDLGYLVDGETRWTGLQSACPGDSGWHTVSVEWMVAKEHLPETPELRSIRGGVRSEGSGGSPIFVSGARAWVVSTGL